MTSAIAADFTVPIEMLKPWIEHMADEIKMPDQLCYAVYNKESAQWTFTPNAELIIKILNPDYKLEMSSIHKYPSGRHDRALYKTMQICKQLDIYATINADGTHGHLSCTENDVDRLNHIEVEIDIDNGRIVETPRMNIESYKLAKIAELIHSGQPAQVEEINAHRNDTRALDDLRDKINQILIQEY